MHSSSVLKEDDRNIFKTNAPSTFQFYKILSTHNAPQYAFQFKKFTILRAISNETQWYISQVPLFAILGNSMKRYACALADYRLNTRRDKKGRGGLTRLCNRLNAFMLYMYNSLVNAIHFTCWNLRRYWFLKFSQVSQLSGDSDMLVFTPVF